MANPFSSPTNDLFNITIDDTSPTIVYTPAADTFGSADIINSWNPSFNGTNFASPSTLGMTGQGQSFHITARDGATFNIKWNGKSKFSLALPGLGYHPATFTGVCRRDAR